MAPSAKSRARAFPVASPRRREAPRGLLRRRRTEPAGTPGAALAAASAEFFPEHATLGATLATSLLRHREQAWRDAEEDYLSRLLTLAFCAFCGVADYAIMVH